MTRPRRTSVIISVILLVRAVITRTRARQRDRDLLLYAAGLTFYAALGLIPLLLIGLRLAGALLGDDSVRQTGAALARFTPTKLGAAEAVRKLADIGAHAGWWSIVVAVVPASLYSEGLVRSLDRFADGGDRRRPSLRGRVLTAALIGVVALGAAIAVGLLRPLALGNHGTGLLARLLGILLAFIPAWFGFTAVLLLLYRVYPASTVPFRALLLGSAATGSWLAGQTLGFLLVLRLATGVGTAYGGSVLAGAASTVLFLLYLDNLVLLGGYALTLSIADATEGGWRRPSAVTGRGNAGTT